MEKFQAKLRKIEKLTADVWHLDFEHPGSDFLPGQFYIMDVEDGKEGKVARSYSLASKPGGNGFALCIKIVPGGRASDYFVSMSEGKDVTFNGPFGHFYLQDSQKDILFVATGTGIAPFMSMLPVLFEKGFDKNVTLYFGLRDEKDIFYVDILEKWQSEHPNFKMILTLSQPSATWAGEKGRVTAHLEKLVIDPANTKVYICGVGAMVKDVKTLMEGKGLTRTDIHFELFTPVS